MLTDNRIYPGQYNAALLEECLTQEEISSPLLLYSELASTNTTAKELAARGVPSGSAVLAESQSAGRGRLGRSFFSPKGGGIYLSIVLRPPREEAAILRLTTAVCVAVCAAVSRITGIHTDIKWVNDIYLHEKKLCGILCEGVVNSNGTLDAVVAGIGINVERHASEFPAELAHTACALYESDAPTGIREALLAAILREVTDCTNTLLDGSYLPEYRRRSMLLGREVVLMNRRPDDPNTAVTALAIDIDDLGGLVVQYSDGTRESLHTGEVTVRVK
ncbi:MAG: biotin--[acetyl-CoA-carboxylase] ligase [Lachnospiraceae bacterium]|nr:biotin--[acetyl-CoA-carboxylase] ligase [Lachnospiraceae bacterium]